MSVSTMGEKWYIYIGYYKLHYKTATILLNLKNQIMKQQVIFLSVFFVLIIINNSFAQNYFKEGSQKYESNDFKGALVDFGKYIDENKSNQKLVASVNVEIAYQLAALSSLYICDLEKSKNILSDFLKRPYLAKSSRYFGNHNLGYIAYLNNDFKTAINYFNKAIDAYKKNSEAVLLRGICHKELGNIIDAEKDFNSSLKNNDSDLNKAMALFYLNERQKGITQLNEIIKSNPSMLDYYQTASLFALIEDIDNSFKYLDLALGKGLDNYPVYIFYDKNFNKIRNEDEYINIIAKYNLKDNYHNTINNQLETDNSKKENIISENTNIRDIETEKYLQNNQIYGSFFKGTDGTIYLIYNSSLFKLCSNSGDSWCKIADEIQTASVHPTNQNIIYSINTQNHICKTMDGGKTWRLIENGFPSSVAPYSVVIDPQNSEQVFVLASNGLYKSKDAGFLWEPVITKIQPVRFQMDYYNENKYYLLTRDYTKRDLLMTTDKGETWNNIGANLPKILVQGTGRSANYETIIVYDFLFYSNQQEPFILAFTSLGIFLTKNDGVNWTEINDGFTTSDIISSSYLSDKEIYLATYVPSNLKSKLPDESTIYKLSLPEMKWGKINCKIDNKLISGIIKDNIHQGILFHSSNKLEYIDKNLNKIGLNYGVTQHSIVHDVNYSIINDTLTIFAIVENDNDVDIDRYGLWKSTNNGLTWSKSLMYDNSDLIGNNKILISPLNSLEIWILDGDSKYFSTDEGRNWNNASNYLGFRDKIQTLRFDYNNKDIIYYTRYYGKALSRFDRKTQNSTFLCDVKLYSTFAIDIKNNKNITTSNYTVSIDGGWTWNSYSEKLSKLMHERIAGGIDKAPREVLSYFNNTIRLRLGDRPAFILISKDNGENWEIESSFDEKIKIAYINPNNPQHMIIIKELNKSRSFLGLSVLVTEDAHNWTQISEYLKPENDINNYFYHNYYNRCVFIRERNNNLIYSAGTGGLISSDNFGKIWQRIGGINENN
jgi:photosystem II stability/assembly factor-like uncharacterized protein